MTERPTEGSTSECALCDAAVTPADEYWCTGCEEVICADCGEGPWGSHDADDHRPPCDICGEPGHDVEDCELYEEGR